LYLSLSSFHSWSKEMQKASIIMRTTGRKAGVWISWRPVSSQLF